MRPWIRPGDLLWDKPSSMRCGRSRRSEICWIRNQRTSRSYRKSGWQVFTPSSADLDLRDVSLTLEYLKDQGIGSIIHCAARVGGIAANIAAPADFILNNLQIDSSIISSARKLKIQKFIFYFPSDGEKSYLFVHLVTLMYEKLILSRCEQQPKRKPKIRYRTLIRYEVLQ